jgi:hypothetical protein
MKDINVSNSIDGNRGTVLDVPSCFQHIDEDSVMSPIHHCRYNYKLAFILRQQIFDFS